MGREQKGGAGGESNASAENHLAFFSCFESNSFRKSPSPHEPPYKRAVVKHLFQRFGPAVNKLRNAPRGCAANTPDTRRATPNITLLLTPPANVNWRVFIFTTYLWREERMTGLTGGVEERRKLD